LAYRVSRLPLLSKICEPWVATVQGTSALGFPASVWLIMAAAFILAGIKFPQYAVTLWFLGLSGFLAGGASQFFELTWQLQLIVFGLSGIALVLAWSRLDQPPCRTGDELSHNRHPTSLLGRAFLLQKPIVNGTGMLTVGGTTWRIAGQDCAAGDQVLVVHVEGTLLVVNAVAR
jgi:membrane protein implicated in regulation of membrane protease activity